MNLVKELRKSLIEDSLKKKEDPEAYKKIANEGLILGHPVKIKGKNKRSDNNVPYHATVKFFNSKSDIPENAHKTASHLEMTPPNPKEVEIEPTKIKSSQGDDIYAIKLHGPYAEKIKEHHKKFSHMGQKENYEFHPHISVPKEIHDEVKSKGYKTAHDAGIEFGHAELKQGNKTLHTYHKNMEKSEELNIKHSSHLDLNKGDKDISEKTLAEIQKDTAWTWASRAAACYEKLAKTGDWKWKIDAEEYRHEAVEHAALIGDTHPDVLEEIHNSLEKYRKESQKEAEELNKNEKLEKGTLKNILTAGAMATALASPQTAETKVPSQNSLHPTVSAKTNNNYNRQKMLDAIAMVESSGGKNTKHKPTSMGTAYGKFAIMPDVIQDTIRLNPDLKNKHAKALRLKGNNLTHYLQDNPKLEQEIVDRHLNRLEHHFGNNPEAISYAWNHGITGTNRALKNKQNISEHPYVKKFKQYYGSEK